MGENQPIGAKPRGAMSNAGWNAFSTVGTIAISFALAAAGTAAVACAAGVGSEIGMTVGAGRAATPPYASLSWGNER